MINIKDLVEYLHNITEKDIEFLCENADGNSMFALNINDMISSLVVNDMDINNFAQWSKNQ